MEKKRATKRFMGSGGEWKIQERESRGGEDLIAKAGDSKLWKEMVKLEGDFKDNLETEVSNG